MQHFRQSPILLTLLIIAGALGTLHHVTVMAEWRAMYPTDPREKAALRYCFGENHEFNRMSEKARKGCYEKWMPFLPDKVADLWL